MTKPVERPVANSGSAKCPECKGTGVKTEWKPRGFVMMPVAFPCDCPEGQAARARRHGHEWANLPTSRSEYR